MLFPTLDFALFFLVVFAAGWALNRHYQYKKFFFVLASYFFYGYWNWRFVFLLLGSSLMNYAAGRFLDITRNDRNRKWIVAAAVALNLLTLGIFKYYGFFMESLAEILYALNWGRDLPILDIVLPVGISFFTFQGISYVIDVYRGQVTENRSLLNVVLYISFFPQLVAGPIVRASYFLPQLDKPPHPGRILSGMGLLMILWGLFKKTIISNYLAVEMVDDVFFDPTVYGPVDLLLALYGYSIQLYCDFSAYSDIAIGVAALLGYRFPKNFNQPWRSETVGEFWQRWHISLSTWLRDYLYIPLGGSYHGKRKTVRNIFITMFLGGIWHGAGWTYVLWSIYQAGAMALERGLELYRPKPKKGPRPVWRRILGVLMVFHLFAASWILFRATSLEVSWQYLTSFGNLDAPVNYFTPFILSMLVFGMLINFAPANTLARLENGFTRLPFLVQGAVVGLILVAIDAFGMEGVAPFIYFQF